MTRSLAALPFLACPLLAASCSVLYDGELAALEVTPGTLSPAFDPDIRAYELSLPDVDAVDVTARAAFDAASVSIGGAQVEPGGTVSVPVDRPETDIEIVVEDTDGTRGTYTVTAVPGALTDASLADLSLSGSLTLEPAFDPQISAYTVAAPNPVLDVEVTASPTRRGARVTIEGAQVEPGAPSAPIDLPEGETRTVSVVVTALDGTTTRTTTLDVTRAASDDAALMTLGLQTLDGDDVVVSNFDPAVTAYELDLPAEIGGLQVAPVPVESDATVQVNGIDVAPEPVIVPLTPGAVTPIIVDVIAPDRVTTQATTIDVTRAAPPCVPNPGALTPQVVLDLPRQAVGVDIDRGLAVVAAGRDGLHLVDVSDPEAPMRRSTFETVGEAWKVDLVDRRAFVATLSGGVDIVDVSEPATPTRDATFATDGDAYQVVVEDGVALVAADDAGLQLVDVSDPSAPSLLATWVPDTSSGLVRGVAVRDAVAYVGSDASLYSLDVSDPSAPAVLDQVTFNNDNRGEIVDVDLFGDFAGVAMEVDATTGNTGLTIVGIADPDALERGNESSTRAGEARSFLGLDGTVYAAWADRGLTMLNAVDERPVLDFLGYFDVDGEGFDTATDGDRIYVAAGAIGLVSFPPRRLRVAWDPLPRVGSAVRGDGHLFVATSAGLSVLTFDDPSYPTGVVSEATLDLPGDLGGLHLAGDTLYIALGPEGVAAVDVSDPTSPTLLAERRTSGAVLDVTVLGGDVVVVEEGGLQVLTVEADGTLTLGDAVAYDWTDRDDPRIHAFDGAVWVTDRNLTGAWPLVDGVIGERVAIGGGTEDDLARDGSTLYLAGRREVEILDASDPLAPTTLGTIDVGRFGADRIALGPGSDLYTVVEDTLVRWDVSDPSAAVEGPTWILADLPRELLILGGVALASDRFGTDGLVGVEVRDVCELEAE